MRVIHTESTTVTPDGLVALIIIDHNISLTNGSRGDKVNGVAAQVGVCEQLRAVPSGLVL